MTSIVDTNVLALADHGSAHPDPECALKAICYLEALRSSGSIGLDSGGIILNEYQGNVCKGMQPGVGHSFLMWLYINQYGSGRVDLFPIHTHPAREFVEFPSDPDLIGFDRSDRKFAAVAVLAGVPHEIVNATDSDWWDYQRPFARNSVTINFLCPHRFVGRPCRI